MGVSENQAKDRACCLPLALVLGVAGSGPVRVQAVQRGGPATHLGRGGATMACAPTWHTMHVCPRPPQSGRPQNRHQEGSGLHETLEPGRSHRGARGSCACWAHLPTAGVRRWQVAGKLTIPPHVPPNPGPWPTRPQHDSSDPASVCLGPTWPPYPGQVCGHHWATACNAQRALGSR